MILSYIVCLLMLPLTLHQGGTGTPFFSCLSVENGLSNNTVNDIFFDDKGIVYLATKDGLNRFDGTGMEIYRPNALSGNQDVGNYVGRVLGHNDDLLLLLPDYLGILSGKEFRTVPCKGIDAMACSDGILVAHGNTVSIFRDDLSTFEEYVSLNDNFQISSLEAAGDTLWIGTKQGILYMYDKGKQPVQVAETGKIAEIFRDGGGNIWVCSWTKGLFRVNADLTLSNWRHNASDSNTISSDFVRTCCEDRQGNLWIGSIKGLDKLDPVSGTISHFCHQPGVYGTLSDDSIWKIRMDRQGNLWIATYYGGVNYFNPEVNMFSCYHQSVDEVSGLSSPIVGRIYTDSKDNLWMATEKGIDFLDRSTGHFRWWGASETSGPVIEHVKALNIDESRGHIWVGADLGGVYRIDIQTGKVKPFHNNPADSLSIPGDRVRDLVRYGDDSLIVATQSGICMFSKETGRCRRILRGHDEIKVVTNVFLDAQGRLWIVENNRGLFRYHFESDSLKSYSGTDSPGKFVNCVFQDSSGRIWAGTSDSGLYRYNPGNDNFNHISSLSENLSSDCVLSIRELPSGNELILGTATGFSVYSTKTGYVGNYDTRSGFPFSAANENSLCVTADGFVYIGSTQGMVSFESTDLFMEPRPFDILVTGCSVDGNAVDEREMITVRSGSSVGIELAVTNFIPSVLVRLEYSYDGEWLPVPPDGKIDIPEIGPGRHIVQIRPVNSSVCQPVILKIRSRMNPVTVVLAVLAFVFLAVLTAVLLKRRSGVSLQEEASQEEALQEEVLQEEVAAPTKSRILMEKATGIIEENISNSDFDISEFCIQMGMSRTVLFQKIKEAADKTPNELILGIRLKKAADLLGSDPDKSVADVAEAVGFSSSAYFSQKFKETYKISPLAYRKQKQEK